MNQLKKSAENSEAILKEKNFEIHGIPHYNNENLNDTIINIAKNLDMQMDEKDIDNVYRIKKHRKEGSSKPEPIIVTFMRREMKEKFISLRRHRSMYAREIGFEDSQNQVFINDHLTKRSKELLWKARNLKREKNYKYVWYKNGNIYLRKNDNTEAMRISNESDLLKL